MMMMMIIIIIVDNWPIVTPRWRGIVLINMGTASTRDCAIACQRCGLSAVSLKVGHNVNGIAIFDNPHITFY